MHTRERTLYIFRVVLQYGNKEYDRNILASSAERATDRALMLFGNMLFGKANAGKSVPSVMSVERGEQIYV